MTTLLGRIFGKSEKRAVGIDMGTSAIKIVELYTDSGHVHLETYGSVALGPYADIEVGKATNLSAEKMQDALQKILNETGSEAKDVAVTIPFNASLISVIRLPKASESRLAQIIPIEARKYIPAVLEEVKLNWSVFDAQPDVPVDNKEGDSGEEEVPKKEGKESIEQIDVLLAAIHNDHIERYEDILRKISLDPSIFEIEIFSTLRSILPVEGSLPMAVMDIGAGSTKIYIVEAGVVRSSHTINRGSQDITIAIAGALNISDEEAEMVKRAIGVGGSFIHAEEAVQTSLEYLFSETARVIEDYEKKRLRSLDKIILSGGGSAMKGLQKVAQEKLEKNVFVGNPFDRVKSLPFMKETLARVGPEFAPALGAALRAVGTEI